MKKYNLVLVFYLIYGMAVSQVTIDDTDMPVPGDTLRQSITNIIPVDYAGTGTDTTWDFSGLTPMVQRMDSFIDVTPFTVPVAYYAVFGFGVSNLASPGNNSSFFPGLAVTNTFTFYKNGSSGFDDVGFATTVMGIPVPLRYDSPDKYYSFPLSAGSTWSSQSSVNVSLPGMGSYYSSRQRSSMADGWGMLITPFGSFQTLRVRSELAQFDSLYIDSIGMGIPIYRNITQYKWLGKGQGIPLLEIDQEGLVATAYYRDFYHPAMNTMSVDIGPDTSVCPGSQITLTATVTGGIAPYHYIWSTFDTSQSITLTIDSTMTVGIVAVDATNNFAFNQVVITANCPGISEKDQHRLEIFPNPAAGKFYIRIPVNTDRFHYEISSASGRLIVSGSQQNKPGDLLKLNVGGLSAGVYVIRLIDGTTVFTGKITVRH